MLKIGIVDLCTSHPQAFIPILRDLGCEISAVYDSAQTRDEGFVNQFAAEMNIPNICDDIEKMVPLVDAVTIHSADWGVHIDRARPFIEAGKFVCIDKPVVGNLEDIKKLQQLNNDYPGLIFGGSACAFVEETRRLANIAQSQDDQIISIFAGGPFDMFSYGIHTLEMAQQIAGHEVEYVTCLQKEPLGNFLLHFAGGFDAHIHMHTPFQCWFVMLEMKNSAPVFAQLDPDKLYPAFLKNFVDFCDGNPNGWVLENALEPVRTALAIQRAAQVPGERVLLSELTGDDNFAGREFAKKYSQARDQGDALYLIEKQQRWGNE